MLTNETKGNAVIYVKKKTKNRNRFLLHLFMTPVYVNKINIKNLRNFKLLSMLQVTLKFLRIYLC